MIKRSYTIYPLLIVIYALLVASTNKGKKLLLKHWERPTVVYPPNNPFSKSSIELGSELFFETLLSKDSSISCQSCHLVTEAFADHLVVGEGILGRTVNRNTPSLTNIGLHPYFMVDGKFNSLEEQVLGPINEHREFDMSPEKVIHRLKNIPRYDELSKAAYDESINIEIVKKALANFERTLVSEDSRFDQFMKGEIEFTAEEKTGWKLFKSPKLNCIQCHSGYNFTNYSFENNGLYETYLDSGRALITGIEKDIAKFKIPSLRNIAVTYPYMHDGSIKSLEEVIDHYSSGGKGHKSQSDMIKGFSIQADDKNALIAYLETLTDTRFVEKSE
jgi:cytochrome c peroxidase